MSDTKGLTFEEVHNIVCLIRTQQVKNGYTHSKALLKRMSFPSIKFEHKPVLDKLNIGNRISQFNLSLLEYYNKEVYDFDTVIIPIYYMKEDGLFYEDADTDPKKTILPTKETLDAAFALVEKVNKLVSKESK